MKATIVCIKAPKFLSGILRVLFGKYVAGKNQLDSKFTKKRAPFVDARFVVLQYVVFITILVVLI